ncbi:MAG: hypothetical protein ACXVPU_13095 [Bacteroidia bacterium]
MKTKVALTLAILLAFVSFSKITSAQDSTFRFSKVIFYDIAASGTQAITVPANKIWEVESVSMGSSGSAPAVFLKNSSGQNMAFFSSPVTAASANYPFLLPDNFNGTLVNNNSSFRCSVSIMEFSKAP